MASCSGISDLQEVHKTAVRQRALLQLQWQRAKSLRGGCWMRQRQQFQAKSSHRDYRLFVEKAKKIFRGYSWQFVVTKSLPDNVKYVEHNCFYYTIVCVFFFFF